MLNLSRNYFLHKRIGQNRTLYGPYSPNLRFPARFFSSNFRDYKDMDLYNILKLDRSATQAQIKQAYYELAKRYHPDSHQHAAASSAGNGDGSSAHLKEAELK